MPTFLELTDAEIAGLDATAIQITLRDEINNLTSGNISNAIAIEQLKLLRKKIKIVKPQLDYNIYKSYKITILKHLLRTSYLINPVEYNKVIKSIISSDAKLIKDSFKQPDIFNLSKQSATVQKEINNFLALQPFIEKNAYFRGINTLELALDLISMPSDEDFAALIKKIQHDISSKSGIFDSIIQFNFGGQNYDEIIIKALNIDDEHLKYYSRIASIIAAGPADDTLNVMLKILTHRRLFNSAYDIYVNSKENKNCIFFQNLEFIHKNSDKDAIDDYLYNIQNKDLYNFLSSNLLSENISQQFETMLSGSYDSHLFAILDLELPNKQLLLDKLANSRAKAALKFNQLLNSPENYNAAIDTYLFLSAPPVEQNIKLEYKNKLQNFIDQISNNADMRNQALEFITATNRANQIEDDKLFHIKATVSEDLLKAFDAKINAYKDKGTNLASFEVKDISIHLRLLSNNIKSDKKVDDYLHSIASYFIHTFVNSTEAIKSESFRPTIQNLFKLMTYIKQPEQTTIFNNIKHMEEKYDLVDNFFRLFTYAEILSPDDCQTVINKKFTALLAAEPTVQNIIDLKTISKIAKKELTGAERTYIENLEFILAQKLETAKPTRTQNIERALDIYTTLLNDNKFSAVNKQTLQTYIDELNYFLANPREVYKIPANTLLRRANIIEPTPLLENEEQVAALERKIKTYPEIIQNYLNTLKSPEGNETEIYIKTKQQMLKLSSVFMLQTINDMDNVIVNINSDDSINKLTYDTITFGYIATPCLVNNLIMDRMTLFTMIDTQNNPTPYNGEEIVLRDYMNNPFKEDDVESVEWLRPLIEYIHNYTPISKPGNRI